MSVFNVLGNPEVTTEHGPSFLPGIEGKPERAYAPSVRVRDALAEVDVRDGLVSASLWDRPHALESSRSRRRCGAAGLPRTARRRGNTPQSRHRLSRPQACSWGDRECEPSHDETDTDSRHRPPVPTRRHAAQCRRRPCEQRAARERPFAAEFTVPVKLVNSPHGAGAKRPPTRRAHCRKHGAQAAAVWAPRPPRAQRVR